MNVEDALVVMGSLAEASDAVDLHKRVAVAVRKLGCEQFLIGMQIHLPAGPVLQHVDSGYSQRWQQRYFEKRYITVDPLIGYCQTNTAPVVWDQSLYKYESHELMEDSRSHGLGYGVTVPVHQSESAKSMFSIARDQPFDDPREEALVKATAGALANYVHVATARLVLPELLAQASPKLTERELACLRLVAQGKGSGLISDRLNIAEPTVNYHLGKVMKKLGVATRVQAVAMAIQLKIIT
jgi:DNA-binding CsgD family transcriptional regulator